MQFTKEQLIEKLKRKVAVAESYPDVEEAKFDVEVFRIALASLEADSDSHPAHSPLSNGRLHRIREILGKAAAQSDGGNIGYAMSDAVRAFDELLEVRKAEPVAYIRSAHKPDGSCFADGIHPTHRHQRLPLSTLQDGCYWKVTPLYAAPPAPLAIDERAAFNAWNNEDNLPIAGVGAKNAAWLAWQSRARLGIPTVPDERKAFEAFMDKRFGDTIDQSRAKNGDQGYMAWDMVVAWVVWQGRAALLAGGKS